MGIAITRVRDYPFFKDIDRMQRRKGPSMRARDRLVVEACYASWAAKDLDAVLSCFSDDVVYTMHLSEELAPFAGESRGKAAMAPRLQMIIDDFDFLVYRPTFYSDESEVFHAQVHYRYRHKKTGYVIEGTMRHIWHVEGDKVVQLEEFHDSPRLHAFFELLAEAESGKPQRSFPNIKRNR
jgi:ketosteroid isomerase-like protein